MKSEVEKEVKKIFRGYIEENREEVEDLVLHSNSMVSAMALVMLKYGDMEDDE